MVKTLFKFGGILFLFLFTACSEKDYGNLTKEEYSIIVEKGTEPKYSGIYNDHFEEGTYSCKQCSATLFESGHKFKSKSGWPSFDDFIPGKVKVKNADAVYTEITCTKCGGHLGHLKKGENLTEKNKRYCVNSLSLKFESK